MVADAARAREERGAGELKPGQKADEKARPEAAAEVDRAEVESRVAEAARRKATEDAARAEEEQRAAEAEARREADEQSRRKAEDEARRELEPVCGRPNVLLEISSPEIYRTNPFRILQLPVDSTARDFARQTEKMKLAEKLGGAQLAQACAAQTGLFHLDADIDAAREANHRLEDPERRLVDEFFWFWPMELGKGKSDSALAALAQGDEKVAENIWLDSERCSSEGNVGMHNVAVFAHATALDAEHLSQTRPLDKVELERRDDSWNSAYQRWKALLESEGFWSRLAARIRELDYPQLTTGTARRFRSFLPLCLLSINAQLAVRAAERRDGDETKRHLLMMGRSGFERKDIDEALRLAAEPVRQRVKTACKTAEADSGSDAIHADDAANRLLEQVRPLLAVLDLVLSPGNPTRDGAHDESALAALKCQIEFGNKTENWRASLALLEQILPIAASESARTRIENNLKIVRANAESGNDWCADGYFDLPVPVYRQLQQAHEQANLRNWDEAIQRLESLLSTWQTPSLRGHLPFVRKPLAFCLNMQAVALLNRGMDEFNQPVSIVRKAAAIREMLPRFDTAGFGPSNEAYKAALSRIAKMQRRPRSLAHFLPGGGFGIVTRLARAQVAVIRKFAGFRRSVVGKLASLETQQLNVNSRLDRLERLHVAADCSTGAPPDIQVHVPGVSIRSEADEVVVSFDSPLFSASHALKSDAKRTLSALGRQLEPYVGGIAILIIGFSGETQTPLRSARDVAESRMSHALSVFEHLVHSTKLQGSMFALRAARESGAAAGRDDGKSLSRYWTVKLRISRIARGSAMANAPHGGS